MILDRAPAFFSYLNEREEVRLRKEAGLSLGFDEKRWTDDPILGAYKFTNVNRHHDRTSMMLRELFYKEYFNDDKETILMNCALFRYFGTWEFAQAVGWQTYENFDFDGIKALAKQRLCDRERVFTGAYVITNQGISAPKQEVVVDIFLSALHEAASSVVQVATTTQSWRQTAAKMRPLKGFGGSGFMTKEILLDTTYTGFWGDYQEKPNEYGFTYPSDWWEWTPIGPGALRGAARILGDDSAKPVKEDKAFGVIMDLYNSQDDWNGDKLSPTDIQFGFCEFDKYERVRLGQGRPRSRYHVK